MIGTEQRIEKRHKLTINRWRVTAKPTTGEAESSTALLNTFGPDQVRELFGETDAATLKLEAFEAVNPYLVTPVAWDPYNYDYDLVRECEEFELLEASAPQGELGPAINGVFELPEARGKWCVLILNQVLGEFKDHEKSPLFVFPTNVWSTQAQPVIVPYITQIESVRYFLPKLKIFYMFAFLTEAQTDEIMSGAILTGENFDETATMLTGKVARAKAQQS